MVAGLLLVRPATTEAHAALLRSTPGAGELVPASPTEIVLQFAETTERDYTVAELYDAAGKLVVEAPLVPEDQGGLVLSFTPPALADGTYTVVWRNVSAVDGHALRGSFTFYVGERSQEPVVSIGDLASGGPPKALSVFSRWATFAAHSLLLGIAACVLFVLAPALRTTQASDALRKPLGRAIGRLWWGSLAFAILASVLAVLMQAWRSAGGFSDGLDGISALVSHSRFGHIWLAKMLLLGLMAYATLLLDRGLFGGIRRSFGATTVAWLPMLAGGLGLATTISLGGHAAASHDNWREFATFADFVHTTGAGFWLGGLVTLAVAVSLFRRAEDSAGLLAASVPRFSALAIAAVVAISLTGLLQWYLRIGNLHDTLHSGYGLSLVAKTLLLLPMLAFGAVNLLVLSPRFRAVSHDAALSSARFLRRHVIAEALLGALVLVATGFLTDTSPPVPSTASTTSGITRKADVADLHLTLTVSPSIQGSNDIAVHLDDHDGPKEEVRNVIVRLKFLDEDFGQSEEKVVERDEDTYGVDDAELGVPGNWEVLVIVQRKGVPDATEKFDITVGS